MGRCLTPIFNRNENNLVKSVDKIQKLNREIPKVSKRSDKWYSLKSVEEKRMI